MVADEDRPWPDDLVDYPHFDEVDATLPEMMFLDELKKLQALTAAAVEAFAWHEMYAW